MDAIHFDSRWVAFAVWGLGTVAVYGYVFLRRRHTWRIHRHDLRSTRDLIESGALLMVAVSACVAVFMVLFGEPGVGLRPFLTALALGSFTGAGVVMATERMQHDPAEDDEGG